ncbi:hydrogenase 4 subunit B [Thiolapillus brandeum]|nr:hydrogenase 4 subunit B [Thiolapillus brandeum]
MDPLVLALTGIVLALASAGLALFSSRYSLLTRALVIPLLGVSGILVAVSGIQVLLSGSMVFTAELPFGLPWLAWHVRLDMLSAFFLLLIGVVCVAVAFYAPGYVREFEHGRNSMAALGGFTGLFVAGMQLVVLADDAFLFMVAWELMSLSSYFLVTFQHEHSANRRAGFLYLMMAEIGALCILLSYGVLAGNGHGFAFDAMRAAQVNGMWATVAFALAFLGFGMKAGLLPVHAWLPEAHPVAPSHISALMSGVMLKVAVYGFIRFSFDLLGGIQWGWGVAVLLVGSVSALMGVLYALMQHDLKRLLAYHSVENIGIIFIGLGLAMVFEGTGHHLLAALGLVAALYHTINHALFKSLLFLGAGAVLHSSHQRDMEHMGGLLKLMPWTGLFFLVGCISIAALPPFNGFVSEWLTFQAALQAWALENGVLRSLIPITAAMLALTGALAAACFVKVYGVSFLGQARSKQARKAREVDPGMRLGQGLLAGLCLLLGVFPATVIQLIDTIPRELLHTGLDKATAHGWLWLTPMGEQTASYSAPLVLLGLLVAWWLAAWVLRRGAVREVRRCDAWDCGFSPLNARMQYTATAFAQPIRRVFGMLFLMEEAVKHDEGGRLRHSLHVGDRLWGWLYAPVIHAARQAGRVAGRLQTGHLRNYLGWTLGTLVVVLWLIS